MVARYGRNSADEITNIYLEAARGNVNGVSVLHKFGHSSNFDSGDGEIVIWDGVHADLAGPKITEYTYSTSADIDTISSSDAGDTQLVEVQGLDSNWELTIQEVTLNGQTDVTLTTPLIRAFRVKNIGTTDFAGSVYLRTNGSAQTAGVPDVGTTVRAIVVGHDNQTQMAVYTVPDGYTLHVHHVWAGIIDNTDEQLQLELYVRNFEKIFRVQRTSVLSSSVGNYESPYVIPVCYPARTDIEFKALHLGTTNGSQVSAGFHALLVKD